MERRHAIAAERPKGRSPAAHHPAAGEACVSGQMMNSAAQELFNVPYTPDFDVPDKSPQYALRSGAKLCLFELRVSDLLKAGDNVLVVENTVTPAINRPLVVADVRLEMRTPVKPKPKRPAPTGPLDVVVPDASTRFPIGSPNCPGRRWNYRSAAKRSASSRSSRRRSRAGSRVPLATSTTGGKSSCATMRSWSATRLPTARAKICR